MSATDPSNEASAASTTAQTGLLSCVVHPIVLLSVVDHYNRVAKDTKKRVVGMLLGTVSKGVVDITNCYAVPFEEDDKDLNIWYLDHSFHEQMFSMFKKVNASEKLVGWWARGRARTPTRPRTRTPAHPHARAPPHAPTPGPAFITRSCAPPRLGTRLDPRSSRATCRSTNWCAGIRPTLSW